MDCVQRQYDLDEVEMNLLKEPSCNIFKCAEHGADDMNLQEIREVAACVRHQKDEMEEQEDESESDYFIDPIVPLHCKKAKTMQKAMKKKKNRSKKKILKTKTMGLFKIYFFLYEFLRITAYKLYK